MSHSQIVPVEIRTDQGITGFGEISGGPQTIIADIVKTFATVVQGMDPLGHTGIWEKLFSVTSPRPGGIDIALWDIRARRRGCRCSAFSAAPGPRFLPARPAATTWKANRTTPPPRNGRVACRMVTKR